jgi:cation-transporting ATPase I
MILGVVALNGAIGAVQRLQTERSIAELNRSEPQFVTVRRDGKDSLADAGELVVGDIISLRAGEAVPADCRILQATALEADESSLTGESLPVPKGPEPSLAAEVAERSSMLYAGTYVATGEMTAVVVAVGAETEAQRGLTLAGEQRLTGVEQRLRSLVSLTIPAALASGAAVIGSGLLRGHPVSAVAQSGVALAMAAVPEGLPFLATVAQTAAAQRLAKRGALVSNPRSIEALGRIDTLCADKTGTLTEGHIELSVVGDAWGEDHLPALGGMRRRVLGAALRATPDPSGGSLPHPTDQALVDGAERAGVALKRGAPDWTRKDELPFEPGRGFHATVGNAREGALLSVKGAPELVLPACTHCRGPRGGLRPLDGSTATNLLRTVDGLARRGLRVLAVAERELGDDEDLDEDSISGLVFLGFLRLKDPVRPTAAKALTELREAGVTVAMITGDHPSTAEGIAAELGLLNDNGVVTGPEIDALDDASLAERLPEVSVFARVTPSHKLRIVQGYQRLGRVVGMTGDGANDAPAIHFADAGIAFGERATAAARAAADLVVLDDRIETLVDAIVEGRALWTGQ